MKTPFLKQVIFFLIFLSIFISKPGYAYDLDHVIVYWTQNGSSQSHTVNATGTYNISRDPGTQVDVRIYKSSTAPTPSTFSWVAPPVSSGEEVSSNNTSVYFSNVAPSGLQYIQCMVNLVAGYVRIYVTDLPSQYPDLGLQMLRLNGQSYQSGYQFAVGQTITASCRVINTGTVEAGSSKTGFYIGTSSSDYSDRYDYKNTGSLDPNGGIEDEISDTYTFTVDDIGTRYLNFWADYKDVVEEGTAEGNNKQTWGSFTVIGAPVADILDISYPAGPINPNEPFILNVYMKNLGTVSAVDGGISVSFPDVTAVNTAVNPSDYESPQANVYFQSSSTLPNRTAYGNGTTIWDANGTSMTNHYLLMEATKSSWPVNGDAVLYLMIYPKQPGAFHMKIRCWLSGTSSISRDPASTGTGIGTDQQGYYTFDKEITVNNAMPDLTVTAMNTPSTGEPGATYNVTVSVQNIGNLSSPASPGQIRISNDQNFDNGTFLANYIFSAISPGETVTSTSFQITIPYSGFSGNCYLIYKTNFDNSFLESNVTNNSLPKPIIIGVAPVISITEPQTNISVPQGSPVTISWNANGPSGASVTLKYDLDTDPGNANETTIASDLPLTDTYSWPTDDVPLNTYHVLGIVNGSTGSQATYSPGTVTVYNSSTYTISGTAVSDLHNFDKIPGAIVTLDGNSTLSTTTAWDGSYSLGNIPVGQHTISIMHNGYFWTQSSFTLNVDQDKIQDFSGHCKSVPLVTYDIPATFTPGTPFDITVRLKNVNIAVQDVSAYLDVSFPDLTLSTTSVAFTGQSGFDADPVFKQPGENICKIDLAGGAMDCNYPAEYLLVSAVRTATIFNNQEWSYSLRITPPPSTTFRVFIKGSIGDQRDPVSGVIGQQGLWEKEVVLQNNQYCCNILISANSWTIQPGHSLTVLGRLEDAFQNPIPNVPISVEDPILKQSILNVTNTNQNGEFIYSFNTSPFTTKCGNYTTVFYASTPNQNNYAFKILNFNVLPSDFASNTIELSNTELRYGVLPDQSLTPTEWLFSSKNTTISEFTSPPSMELKTQAVLDVAEDVSDNKSWVEGLLNFCGNYPGFCVGVVGVASCWIPVINVYTCIPSMGLLAESIPSVIVNEAAHLVINSGVIPMDPSEQYFWNGVIDNSNTVSSVMSFDPTAGLIDNIDPLATIGIAAYHEYVNEANMPVRLELAATDVNGYSIGINYWFQDKEAPFVIYNTAQNQWFSENPMFDINFTDNYGLNNIYYQINSNDDSNPDNWKFVTQNGSVILPEAQDNYGLTMTTDWKISNSDWSNLPLNSQSQGLFYLYFKVTDDAGNVYITPNQMASFKFGKDIYPPTVYISYPEENQVIDQTTISAVWDIQDRVVGLLLSGVQNIYYALDQNTNYTMVGPEINSVELSNLTEGNHTLYVYATDNAGNTHDVVQRNFSVNTNINPPNPFSLLSPHNTTVSSLLPSFQWQSTTDPDGSGITYDLWYSYDPAFTGKVVIPELTTTYYQPALPLEDNSVCYWKVKATDGAGQVRWSDQLNWSFYLNVQNDAPAAFSLNEPLNGVTLNDYLPYFDWNNSTDPDPEDEVSYHLQLGTSPSFSNGTFTDVNLSSSEYSSPTPLQPNTTYYWRVIAIDNYGAQTFSSQTDRWFKTPSPTISASLTALPTFGEVIVGECSSINSYSISGSHLTAGIEISAPEGFLISTVMDGSYSGSVTLPMEGGTVPSTSIYVKFCPSEPLDYEGVILNTSANATSQTVQVNGTGTIMTPQISITTSSLDFGEVQLGTSSSPKTYLVSGSGLTQNIGIQAPAGFEISTDPVNGYFTSLSLPVVNGQIIPTTISVVFLPSEITSYSGNIINFSPGANDKIVEVTGTGIPPTLDLINGMASYYKFDGDLTDCVGPINGTNNNTSDVLTGKINHARSFTGNNNCYVETGSYSGFEYLHNGSDFTISVWVKHNSNLPTNNSYHILGNTIGMDRRGIWFSVAANDVYFYVGRPNPYPVVSNQWLDVLSSNTEQWNHLVVTHDGTLSSNQYTLYVNGVNKGTASRVNSYSTGQSFYSMKIGINKTDGTIQPFLGEIDELGFWTRCLEATEVNELYNFGAGRQYPFSSTPPITNMIHLTTIQNDQNACYNASQMLEFGTTAPSFLVENGGSATMISGQTILLKVGTSVQSGGYLHGYIAPAGPFCPSLSLPSNTVAKDSQNSEETLITEADQSGFTLFPNPTTGKFILELTNEPDIKGVDVELFNLFGQKILTQTLYAGRRHSFSIEEQQSGIYLFRISINGATEIRKIIKSPW